MRTESRYSRVVLKLSGEAFADTSIGYGIDADVVRRIAEEVASARSDLGVEIAVESMMARRRFSTSKWLTSDNLTAWGSCFGSAL